jgi:hypothetical protein
VSSWRLTVASLYLIIGLLVQLALGFHWKIHSSSKDTIEGFYHKMLAQTKEARYSVFWPATEMCAPSPTCPVYPCDLVILWQLWLLLCCQFIGLAASLSFNKVNRLFCFNVQVMKQQHHRCEGASPSGHNHLQKYGVGAHRWPYTFGCWFLLTFFTWLQHSEVEFWQLLHSSLTCEVWSLCEH